MLLYSANYALPDLIIGLLVLFFSSFWPQAPVSDGFAISQPGRAKSKNHEPPAGLRWIRFL